MFGVIVGVQDAAWQYAARALAIAPGSLPAGQLVALLATLFSAVQLPPLPLTLMLVVFPNGQLPSRRWRVVPLLAVGGAALSIIATIIVPTIGAGLNTEVASPLGIAGAAPAAKIMNMIGTNAGLIALIAAIAAVAVRWRRAKHAERQQIKWLTYAGAVIGVTLAATVSAMDSDTPAYSTVLVGAFAIAGMTIGVPIALGVAVLKYRLYDINILINRTLVYGTLTASVAGTYILVVGYLGTLFQTRGSLLISLLATGLVAVGFQPLRDRLQRGVNRLMYGERDEPYTVLSRLGAQLENTLAPDAVLPTIVHTIRDALKLPYVAIAAENAERGTLNDEAQRPLEVVAEVGERPPSAPPHCVTFPLAYQHDPVDELLLAPRSPGEVFSPADQRLLHDLARQAGVAVHAVRLTHDLQQSRERLITTREEERRRLRRDLHDGLGPTLASLRMKLDTAQLLMEHDPQEGMALLHQVRDQMNGTIANVRRLVYALRPPVLDQFGLVAAMREHALQLAPADLQIKIDAPDHLPALPAAVEVAAYYIATEALTNVVRHAEANQCAVRLQVDDALHLDIVDDGHGLPADIRAGVGLQSMRERAAELGGACVIEPVEPHGTCVRATLPLS